MMFELYNFEDWHTIHHIPPAHPNQVADRNIPIRLTSKLLDVCWSMFALLEAGEADTYSLGKGSPRKPPNLKGKLGQPTQSMDGGLSASKSICQKVNLVTISF